VAVAQAGLDQARLNLSYTHLYADLSGTVANRTVQVGSFVQAGESLFSAVPNEVYVVANFKETQLSHMRAGQPVSIMVDAFPGMRFRGHIDSFQRGTGSYFALLPPENATGNFIKVVQRIPVKILLNSEDLARASLAPGRPIDENKTRGCCNAPQTKNETDTLLAPMIKITLYVAYSRAVSSSEEMLPFVAGPLHYMDDLERRGVLFCSGTFVQPASMGAKRGFRLH
jgi:hypothetical protein